jgi:hypothetical protein
VRTCELDGTRARFESSHAEAVALRVMSVEIAFRYGTLEISTHLFSRPSNLLRYEEWAGTTKVS